MLLLSAAFTALVSLLPCVERFLAPVDKHNINVPCVVRYVVTCISKMTSKVGLFKAVLMKNNSSGI
jgi:hypothetical protein